MLKKYLFWASIAVTSIIVFSLGYITFMYSRMGIVSEGATIPKDAPEKSLLLVIDIQDGTTGNSAPSMARGLVQQSGPFIANVNQAIEKAQMLQLPVVYICQENRDRLFNLLMGGTLAQGSTSVAIDKRVKVVSANVFMKNKMDAFSNPEFDAYLREHEINHLYVTGLDAAYCVDRTIKGALKRGYAVTVIPEAVISNTLAQKDKMLKQYASQGVAFVSLAKWQEQ